MSKELNKEYVHPREITFEEGVFLVKLARKAVKEYLEKGKKMKPPQETPEKLLKKGMAFVTIETYHSYEKRSLRGCIGYLEPIAPLANVIIDVAIHAAVGDPRFTPMSIDELDMVTFEVSILSKPELLNVPPRELPRNIIIGRHGLLVKRGFYQGVLLPQVPVEYGWDQETFLAEVCLKAGMDPDCWLLEGTKIYIFEAKLFREKEPLGEVEERNLEEEYRKVLEKLR